MEKLTARIISFFLIFCGVAFAVGPRGLLPHVALPGTRSIGTTLTITAPVQRQVLQRNGSNQATLTVAGSSSAAFDTVQAKVLPRTGYSGTGIAWANIYTHASGTGSYTGTVTLSAGWYDVLVRTSNSGTVVAQNLIERVGVGEIFIGAGQSMLTNSTPTFAYPANDNVSRLSLAGAWTLAADPQVNEDGTGGSVWPSLGDQLSTYLNMPVAFVPVAVGGSAAIEWLSGTTNYTTKLAPALQLFSTNGFRAVLWEQGQADGLTGTTALNYVSRLESAIDSSRSTAGWTVPWVIAESTWLGGISYSVIQGAQATVATYTSCKVGPNNDSLNNTYRQGDGTHFTNAGAVSQATLWKNALVTAFGW